MEDMAVKANEEAILSFYNNFSENLSLEECKQLADVSYLLRTVVHFIESCGELKYQSHEKYGFAETVEYLHFKWEGAEYFVQNLNADAIDDSFEIAKVLLVLVYLARMECPTKVKELLPTKEIHRVALANMLSFLDMEIQRLNNELEDEEYPQDAEESNPLDQYSKLWEECLKRVAPFLSVSQLDTNETPSPMTTKIQCWKSGTEIDVYIDGISNSSSPSNTAINEPRMMGKHGAIRPLHRGSPIFESATFTPTHSLKRRSGCTSRLARRSEVLQNEKRISDLKSELKNLGADYDALQDHCAQLSDQLDRSMNEYRILQEKFNRLSNENGEILAVLEEAQNEKLHLEHDMARLTGADGKTSAFAENEKLKRGKRRVDELLRGVLKEAGETKSMLGKTERQLIETVRSRQKLESEKRILEARISELEELLLSERQSYQREIDQKTDELFAKLLSTAEVQDNYLRRIHQLEYEVLAKKAENTELLSELSRRARETYWNVLLTSNVVTRGGVAALVVIGASVIWAMR